MIYMRIFYSIYKHHVFIDDYLHIYIYVHGMERFLAWVVSYTWWKKRTSRQQRLAKEHDFPKVFPACQGLEGMDMDILVFFKGVFVTPKNWTPKGVFQG